MAMEGAQLGGVALGQEAAAVDGVAEVDTNEDRVVVLVATVAIRNCTDGNSNLVKPQRVTSLEDTTTPADSCRVAAAEWAEAVPVVVPEVVCHVATTRRHLVLPL